MDYGYNSYIAPNYNYSPKPNYNMGGMISPPANNSPWLYVPTAKDVQSVQVQPGQKAWVMDELMGTLKIINNRAYESVLNKVRNI